MRRLSPHRGLDGYVMKNMKRLWLIAILFSLIKSFSGPGHACPHGASMEELISGIPIEKLAIYRFFLRCPLAT